VFRSIVDGERDVMRGLFAALARRTPLLEDKSIEFCRLLTGAAEDVPGLIVDKCGGVVVIDVQINRSPATVDVRDVARWYSDTIHAETVIVRCNVKKDQEPGPGNGASRSRYKEDHVLGRPCPESITVRERGLTFIVRPNQGRSIGLYADHRDNQARVRAMAREKDVLNLFAYTCGFSLAAAVGGAASTVSVDLAGRHLEWGRDNFARNHVDTEHHEFLQADSFEYLRRAARQHRLFDLIIIYPPSFAHGRRRGRDFSVSRDLGPLVTGALTVLKPGGVIMVSTNLRSLSLSGLRQRVRTAAQGHRIRAIDTAPLPTDFAADPDHAKTLFVAFS